ncbi:hypothetical protein BJ742DRAFT_544652 [Cladochytrium replicatum]|nr:hypothetical protein BJ742DRAFT_544652 [Cladochytrium replicatum]
MTGWLLSQRERSQVSLSLFAVKNPARDLANIWSFRDSRTSPIFAQVFPLPQCAALYLLVALMHHGISKARTISLQAEGARSIIPSHQSSPSSLAVIPVFRISHGSQYSPPQPSLYSLSPGAALLLCRARGARKMETCGQHYWIHREIDGWCRFFICSLLIPSANITQHRTTSERMVKMTRDFLENPDDCQCRTTEVQFDSTPGGR